MPSTLPRLLYIDDDARSRDVMDSWLRSRQNEYSATVVPSITDAEAYIQRDRFDLYIVASSDADPARTGLCEAIRNVNENAPVILYSDCDRSIDLRRAAAAGVDLCISKPGDLDVLKGAIPLLLDKSWNRYEATDGAV